MVINFSSHFISINFNKIKTTFLWIFMFFFFLRTNCFHSNELFINDTNYIIIYPMLTISSFSSPVDSLRNTYQSLLSITLVLFVLLQVSKMQTVFYDKNQSNQQSSSVTTRTYRKPIPYLYACLFIVKFKIRIEVCELSAYW